MREAAGARFADLELGILVAQVCTTEDREQAAQFIATTLAAGLNVSTDVILQAPYLLIGTVNQICEDLLARRERFGISYITVLMQIKFVSPSESKHQVSIKVSIIQSIINVAKYTKLALKASSWT